MVSRGDIVRGFLPGVSVYFHLPCCDRSWIAFDHVGSLQALSVVSRLREGFCSKRERTSAPLMQFVGEVEAPDIHSGLGIVMNSK